MGSEGLGKKQRTSNEAWLEALENIEKSVPKKVLDKKVGQTLKDIKEKTKGKKAVNADLKL